MITIEKIPVLKGSITVPGDKSISHRALMLSSLAKGVSRIRNLLMGEDCRSTINAFKNMGIRVDIGENLVTVTGKGLRGLLAPAEALYLGNSGTTMRLLAGILSGQNFNCVLTGDESLSKRPMQRIIRPLSLMGSDIEGRDNAGFAPIVINGSKQLAPINYNSEIASAQVKSAVMFAGLYCHGVTTVTEPCKSRDHTERMFRFFGADVEEKGLSVSVKGLDGMELMPKDIEVPGDISSAAFLLALGVLADDADIIIKGCGINPTRTGIISVLKNMGADIAVSPVSYGYEPVGDIYAKSSLLKGIVIKKQDIPFMIDEIPVIALCAAKAKGVTIIEGIGELRVKETDRVVSIITNLRAFGADIETQNDNLIIKGPVRFKGACVDSFGDHRTAMMSVIAGAVASGRTIVSHTDCMDVSFPGFIQTVLSLNSYKN